MTRPHEVFYVKLVVSANKISDFFALFKVPNRRDTVELYLNEVLSGPLQPDYKVLVHLIQYKQTEILEVKVWYDLLQVYYSASGMVDDTLFQQAAQSFYR